MAGCGGGEVVDGIDNTVQSSIGTDGHIGSDEVIVDGSDEPGDHEGGVFPGYLGAHLAGVDEFSDQVCPLGAQHIQAGERTVTADDDETIDPVFEESGIASRRCFVVETMGRDCGYLALMSGIAAGAERIYTNEDGISLDDLANDVHWLRELFAHGRRLFLAVRNENASHNYTTDFIARLLEEESHGMYDVRQVVLGHMQQGGSPSPFDRLLANRLGYRALNLIDDELAAHQDGSWFIGVNESGMRPCSMDTMPSLIDAAHRRPREQWWLQLRTIARMVSDEVR